MSSAADAFSLACGLADKVKSGEIELDLGGHFGGGSRAKEWVKRHLGDYLFSAVQGDCAEILLNRAAGKKDSRSAIFSIYSLSCDACATEGVPFKITKNGISTVAPCPHPDGYPEYFVRVSVPSGKLVFANDFRDLVAVSGSYDVNTTWGCELTSRAYADAGLIHICVGNSCPGIYQVSDSRLHLLSPESREDRDYGDLPAKEPKGRHIGDICTDLWWFSAMDHDLFKKLAGKDYKTVLKDSFVHVVKIKPGCYKASSRLHLLGAHRADLPDGEHLYPEQLFSVIKWDGDMRKLRAQSKYAKTVAYMTKFENAIKAARLAYPGIYPTRASVLNQWFCVIGNGMEWADGMLLGVGDRHERAVERLKAGEEVTWEEDKEGFTFYPLGSFARFLCVPDDVRPDWLAGVREVLDLVILKGTGPKNGKRYKENLSNIRHAETAKKELGERFGVGTVTES